MSGAKGQILVRSISINKKIMSIIIEESEDYIMLIEGIHHVCIKCSSQEQVAKVKEFYGDVLQMPMIRSWGEDKFEGCMFDTGAGIIEVIADATEDLPQGSIRHFALRTSKVDECIEAVRAAGYKVTMEPTNMVIASKPEFPIRIGFCIGPVGEEVEFFQER